MEEMTTLEKLLSEDNFDTITLYDEDNNAIEFEQVAIVPYEDELYAILAPVSPLEGMGEDEALVFSVDEETESVDLVTDEELGTKIFDIYYAMIAEDEEA